MVDITTIIQQKVAVFLDGDFWHGYNLKKLGKKVPKKYWLPKIERNIRRDKQISVQLRKSGWKVLRFWEHQIKKNPQKAIEKIEKVLPIFPAISVTFIIFICSMVIALNKNRLGQVTGFVLITAVILNLYGMLCGYSIGSAFRMEVRRRRTLAIEIGMQNAGLGTVLALEHFGEQAAIPAAIFVFICIITASVMAEIWQKKPLETVTVAE